MYDASPKIPPGCVRAVRRTTRFLAMRHMRVPMWRHDLWVSHSNPAISGRRCCRHRRCRHCHHRHHHHRPTLLLPLLVGCCVVVCHPLSSSHAVMRPSTLLLPATFAANRRPSPPPPPLPLTPSHHRLHRHHRGQTCHRPLPKKEARAAAPPAYQRQHQRENVYMSRRLGLI
jgi:hypothetical protein